MLKTFCLLLSHHQGDVFRYTQLPDDGLVKGKVCWKCLKLNNKLHANLLVFLVG